MKKNQLKTHTAWVILGALLLCMLLVLWLVIGSATRLEENTETFETQVSQTEGSIPSTSTESLPSEQPSSEETEESTGAIKTTESVNSTETTTETGPFEQVVYITTADLTDDGTDDQICLLIDTPASNHYIYDPDDLTELFDSGYMARVAIYKGIGHNTFEEEPIWTSRDFAPDGETNLQISMIFDQNNDEYLLITSLQEDQGYANYSYKVLALSPRGEELLKEEYAIDFRYSEDSQPLAEGNLPVRSEAVSDFWQHLSKWHSGKHYWGTLIFAANGGMEKQLGNDFHASIRRHTASFDQYYGEIYGTYHFSEYFTFDFPTEWVGKLSYEESKDGKTVKVYHHRTHELDAEKGLLGTVFLADQATAVEYLKTTPARYIDHSLEIKGEGATYAPMVCPSEGPQYVAETKSEFLTIREYFEKASTTDCFWVSSNHYSYDILSARSTYHLENTPMAYFGQTLIWDEKTGETITFNSDGRQHTLQIGDIDFTEYLEKNIKFLVEIGSNPWYSLLDLDIHDNCREIAVFDNGPSGDPTFNILSFDGKNLVFLGTLEARAFEPLKGDGTITYTKRIPGAEYNTTQITCTLQDHQLVDIPQEEYVLDYYNFHNITKDLEVYTKKDLSSEKVTLKHGVEQICFTKLYSLDYTEEQFYEIKTAYDKIYYIHSSQDLYEYVADLFNAD